MNAPIPHADQHYIESLLLNDRQGIDEIYRRFSGKIKAYVINNSGSADDAADIFQETLIDLYQQARYKNLKLSCPFEPFLLLLCKRKWLNELKKRSVIPVTKGDDNLLVHVGQDVVAEAEQVEQQQKQSELYLQAMEELGERCRQIIRETLSGGPQEEIAAKLNVSYGYLRKKKSECMAALVKLIKAKQI